MKIKVDFTHELDELGQYTSEGKIEFTKLDNGKIMNYGRSLPF
jgi:hypothetical protein